MQKNTRARADVSRVNAKVCIIFIFAKGPFRDTVENRPTAAEKFKTMLI